MYGRPLKVPKAPQMFLLDALQTFHFLLGAIKQLQITSMLLLNSYLGLVLLNWWIFLLVLLTNLYDFFGAVKGPKMRLVHLIRCCQTITIVLVLLPDILFGLVLLKPGILSVWCC
jgi:hypothetical protein